MTSGYNTSVVSGRIFHQLTGALTTVISQGQAGELPVLIILEAVQQPLPECTAIFTVCIV